MSTTRRIVIAILIIAVAICTILLVQSLRRGGCLYRSLHEGSEKFTGECVPVYSGSAKAAEFCENDAVKLEKKKFMDKAENKPQEGWLLRDVILLSIKKESLTPETGIRVSSKSRNKKAELSWKDASNETNLIILAPTKKGTLKLASVMKGLDTRTQWVQDVDRIEIIRP